MILYHRGMAIVPSVTQRGRSFVAGALIIKEHGQEISLGSLGIFANEHGALNFAIRCATSFIDGDEMPVPPFNIRSR